MRLVFACVLVWFVIAAAAALASRDASGTPTGPLVSLVVPD
jgi:hypothetical protein